MQRIRRLGLAALAAAAIGLGGCATYDNRYQYQPRPATTLITAEPASEAHPIYTAASVVGVRTKHAKAHPQTVEVRLLVENRSQQSVRVQPSSLELIGGDLNGFPQPVTEPPGALELDPGERATISAFFPYAQDFGEAHDVGGLSLRYSVEAGGQPITRSVTFNLREPTRHYHHHYYDPWYGGPGVHFGLGVGRRF